MRFELDKIIPDRSEDHTKAFVTHHVNILQWLKEFLEKKNIPIQHVVAVVDRNEKKQMSFKEALPALDKLYYRNNYPGHSFADNYFVIIDNPIFNFNLIFGGEASIDFIASSPLDFI